MTVSHVTYYRLSNEFKFGWDNAELKGEPNVLITGVNQSPSQHKYYDKMQDYQFSSLLCY